MSNYSGLAVIWAIEPDFITVLTAKSSRHFMSQQMMLKNPAKTETVCTTCKHFIESEGMFYCKFFDAYFAAETLSIPCEFQEKPEISTSHVPEDF